jgi:hypothetical protein
MITVNEIVMRAIPPKTLAAMLVSKQKDDNPLDI